MDVACYRSRLLDVKFALKRPPGLGPPSLHSNLGERRAVSCCVNVVACLASDEVFHIDHIFYGFVSKSLLYNPDKPKQLEIKAEVQ